MTTTDYYCPEGMELRHGPGGITDNSLRNLSYRAIETTA
jgi:hypothetical protein